MSRAIFTGPHAAASLAYFQCLGREVPSRVQPANLRLHIAEMANHWRASHPMVGAQLDRIAANLEAAILAS